MVKGNGLQEKYWENNVPINIGFKKEARVTVIAVMFAEDTHLFKMKDFIDALIATLIDASIAIKNTKYEYLWRKIENKYLGKFRVNI